MIVPGARRVSRPPRFLAALFLSVLGIAASAQDILTYRHDPIDPEIEKMYVRGIEYLVSTQTDAGTWTGEHGNEPGVVGLAAMAIMAHGEDPNYGPFSDAISKAVSFVLGRANPGNGYIGSTMYNHGFATLALAEAYGSVNNPKIGPALRQAVEMILSSQVRNPCGAWRYSPQSNDADTTVSGAQMVALLAAANAGIAVPRAAIQRGLAYLRSCQCGDGGFGYVSADRSSPVRAAIGATVFALAKKKDTSAFRSAVRYLKQVNTEEDYHLFYHRYYASQALFHADTAQWKKWHAINARRLRQSQRPDGSWDGREGPVFCTSAALLSLALDYRLLPIYER